VPRTCHVADALSDPVALRLGDGAEDHEEQLDTFANRFALGVMADPTAP
jgi:hypothetical protein